LEAAAVASRVKGGIVERRSIPCCRMP
jgi:hypothetical protein